MTDNNNEFGYISPDNQFNTTSEVSYNPIDEDKNSLKQKKRKKFKFILKTVSLFALLIAVSAGSISAYKWYDDNEPLQFISGLIKDNEDDESEDNSNDEEIAVNASSDIDETDDEDKDSEKNWIQLASKENALTIPEIVDKLMPSVVGVSSSIQQGFQIGTSTGTGIIMSEDGYIVTNCHVVEDASQINVVLEDKSEYPAKLVGSDSQTDIAVLKIDATNLTAAEFGDSNDIDVGELAIAIGNPLGFDLFGSVTSGIISAVNREITVGDRNMNLIQTDAAINSGNSGGPLVNCYGQVVGINSVKISSSISSSVEGLGFAIPISEVSSIINDLINNGYVTGRPSIGIYGRDIDEATANFNNLRQGIYVWSVTENGAAENAGIRPGDIIIGAQGTPVLTMDELNEIKNQYKAGDKITLTIYRNRTEIDIDVILEEAQVTQ